MPPTNNFLEFSSLGELYRRYLTEFVQASPVVSICGCRIHCYEHHFVHVVKLVGPDRGRLFFPDVGQDILETHAGLGQFRLEERRAKRLLMALECLRSPEKVVRSLTLDTADRAFIKEFDCSQYPYMVVLVRREESGLLTLCTIQPIRRRQINRWLDGDILFPKTPQPPR